MRLVAVTVLLLAVDVAGVDRRSGSRRSRVEQRMATAAAKSEMTTAEGGELAKDEAFSIILEKSSVSDMERSQFLMMLKAVRATLKVVKRGPDGNEIDSLLEEGNEPLQMRRQMPLWTSTIGLCRALLLMVKMSSTRRMVSLIRN